MVGYGVERAEDVLVHVVPLLVQQILHVLRDYHLLAPIALLLLHHLHVILLLLRRQFNLTYLEIAASRIDLALDSKILLDGLLTACCICRL